jgi:hypothetical protein
LQPLDFATMADPASGVISDDDDLERAIQADGMDMESDSDIRVQNPASKIEEWTLLLRFVTKGSDSTVNIVKIHRDIFRLIQQSDDKFAAKTLGGTLIDWRQLPSRVQNSGNQASICSISYCLFLQVHRLHQTNQYNSSRIAPG